MTAYHISILQSHIALHQMLHTPQQKRAMFFVGTDQKPHHAGLQKSCSQLPGIPKFSTKKQFPRPTQKTMASQPGCPTMEVRIKCLWLEYFLPTCCYNPVNIFPWKFQVLKKNAPHILPPPNFLLRIWCAKIQELIGLKTMRFPVKHPKPTVEQTMFHQVGSSLGRPIWGKFSQSPNSRHRDIRLDVYIYIYIWPTYNISPT